MLRQTSPQLGRPVQRTDWDNFSSLSSETRGHVIESEKVSISRHTSAFWIGSMYMLNVVRYYGAYSNPALGNAKATARPPRRSPSR